MATIKDAQYIKTISDWASRGRDGKIIKNQDLPSILDGIFKHIEVARKKNLISITEEFFCLCALRRSISSPSKHYDDIKSRLDEVTNLVKNNRSALGKGDIKSFERLVKEQERLNEEEKEKKRNRIAEKEEQKKVEELRRQGEELEQKKCEELQKKSDELFKNHIHYVIDQPFLNDQDISLAIEWLNKPSIQIPNRESLITDFGNDYELGRLLSARLAEKAAIEFYRDKYKLDVEDVSIQQIINNECNDWRDYDLYVDKVPVDVKNSRRSQHSPKSYTEHCVPSFKHSRNDQDVRVCGVFSPYIHANELLEPATDHHDKLFILGETTLNDQTDLKSEFEDPELLQIKLHKPNSGTKFFLPPWMFNYPHWAYKDRDNFLEKARGISIPSAKSCETKDINPIPLCIAAGIDLKQYWKDDDLLNWEWEFFHELSERLGRKGLSLPILFLSILKHFLLMVPHPSRDINGYIPYNYKKFIFYKKQFNLPLGICDPLETINVLVDCLNILWKADHDLIKSYKTFKLQGFNILLAKPKSGTDGWKTLIAYCGGRSPINDAACGKNPLVLGECEHCDICGKLICPQCDFCSKGCERESNSPFYDCSKDIPPNIS